MAITVDEICYLEDEIEKYDLVVLQNAVPMEVNEEVARYAYEHQVDVVLNPTPVKKLSKEFMQPLLHPDKIVSSPSSNHCES